MQAVRRPTDSNPIGIGVGKRCSRNLEAEIKATQVGSPWEPLSGIPASRTQGPGSIAPARFPLGPTGAGTEVTALEKNLSKFLRRSIFS